jgi:hypothetical protein
MASKSTLLLAVVAAVASCNTLASAQENRGTPEQRAACVSDAFRLCSTYIPDGARVEYCLRHKKSELSQPCRLVFEQGSS